MLCRIELWNAADLTDFAGDLKSAASDRTATDRYCSYPAIYDNGPGYYIDSVVNYPGLGETGFMLVSANSSGR